MAGQQIRGRHGAWHMVPCRLHHSPIEARDDLDPLWPGGAVAGVGDGTESRAEPRARAIHGKQDPAVQGYSK